MPSYDYEHCGLVNAGDGTPLFYGLEGQGPDITLLDGVGCDGWAWNYIRPHLTDRLRTIHCHYRGHGRSGQPVDDKRIGMADLAEDVERVLDHLEVDRTLLIAHSMGTQVALELYRRKPERIRGFILMCGSFGRITHTFHGNDILHRVLPDLIENVRRYRPLARALWGRLPASLSYRVAGWIGEIDGAAIAADDFRQYVEHLSDIDLDLYLSMLQEAGSHSAEDLLAQVQVPTLVIAADRDTFTPPEVVKAVADGIPGARYVELQGASHAAPLERARTINAELDRFLSELQPE